MVIDHVLDNRLQTIPKPTIAHLGSPDPVPYNIAEHRRIWRSGWSQENGWDHCLCERPTVLRCIKRSVFFSSCLYLECNTSDSSAHRPVGQPGYWTEGRSFAWPGERPRFNTVYPAGASASTGARRLLLQSGLHHQLDSRGGKTHLDDFHNTIC